MILPSIVSLKVLSRIPHDKKSLLQDACVVLGLLIVVWGTLDLISRFPSTQISADIMRQAFAPAATLLK